MNNNTTHECVYNCWKILQKEFKNLQKESCNNKLQKNQNFIENREWDKMDWKKKKKRNIRNIVDRRILQKEFKNFIENREWNKMEKKRKRKDGRKKS